MSNRYDDALHAQGGACNPVALVNALKRHMDEMRAQPDHQGTPALLGDPALRLIVHQLAHLFKVYEISVDGPLSLGSALDEYDRLMRECADKARETREAA